MDALVVAVAVAAWLLLMVPAALALVAGGADVDPDARPATPALALAPPRDRAGDAGRAA